MYSIKISLQAESYFIPTFMSWAKRIEASFLLIILMTNCGSDGRVKPLPESQPLPSAPTFHSFPRSLPSTFFSQQPLPPKFHIILKLNPS
ncbi:hypothetical protein NPIL_164811 [Nephila pilipes]|uniref:Uncharacterized protein n=1 Tax=Nephila pilipes TaxID=299642 RepID=A0A8X6UHV0_NEPPI|nr:hypothetical protein NPIL_164811 [Nephila pilipes]